MTNPEQPAILGVVTDRKEFIMKIKKDSDASTDDFWYDLVEGYLKPEELCEDLEDLKKINAAVVLLTNFQDSCEEQLPNFML